MADDGDGEEVAAVLECHNLTSIVDLLATVLDACIGHLEKRLLFDFCVNGVRLVHRGSEGVLARLWFDLNKDVHIGQRL